MSKFTFGTPATTATTQNFGFSAPTQTTQSFNSGTTFGSLLPSTTAAQPSTQTGISSINFSFGNPVVAPQTIQSNVFNLAGNTATSLFPNSTTQAQPLQIGQTNLQPQSTQSTGLIFGTPTGKSTGLTFASPITTGGLTTTGCLNTGINLMSASQTTGNSIFNTTATTGLSFGSSNITTTSGRLNFGIVHTPGSTSFTTNNTTSLSSSLGWNFGGMTTTTSTVSSLLSSTTGGFFGSKPIITTSVVTNTLSANINRGLGGLDVSISNKGHMQGSTSPTVAKENLLPNELMQTIDGFKEFVKTQKALSSDIARGSARPLNRCSEDTVSLMEILTTLAGSVQRDRSLADKLKQDTAKALLNAEIAQRTHDTPTGLQYENNTPLLFFMELSEYFEHDLMLFKSQIEATEKHIQTMMSPKTLTPQELTMAMNKLHESLVAVAGRLQGVHTKVQQQKEQYLNFRKYVLKDSTNVFEDNKSNGKSSRNNIEKITSGPTPFCPGNRRSFLSSTSLNSVQTPHYGSSNSLVWRNVTSIPSSSISINTIMTPPTSGLNFNSRSNLTAPLCSTDTNSSFQLQKPPVGSKRGKH